LMLAMMTPVYDFHFLFYQEHSELASGRYYLR
jgi:hypothetical protein